MNKPRRHDVLIALHVLGVAIIVAKLGQLKNRHADCATCEEEKYIYSKRTSPASRSQHLFILLLFRAIT